MIDANWTVGYTEQLAGFIYQRSYRIASYKNVNRVDFANLSDLLYIFIPIFLFHNIICL